MRSFMHNLYPIRRLCLLSFRNIGSFFILSWSTMITNFFYPKVICWWMQLWETSSNLQTCEMWNITTMWVFLLAYKPERKPPRRVRGSCMGQSQERRDDLLHDVREKKSRWFGGKAICWVRMCLWLSTRWTWEIPKVLGTSSCEHKWRWCDGLLWATTELTRRLQMIFL